MSYRAELSAAWADHLAPRKPDAPTVVSTFAGCGGSSLGYSMAGYRELLAVEWDDHAAACFATNFPDVPLHHGDIADVDPADLGIPAGALDVLDGSPPCQGFSMAGHRNIDDPRNTLFRQYVRLLEAWQPQVFVMENVASMATGKMKPVFAEIMQALRSAGYRVSARVMDTRWYRVPQARPRLIVVGVRDDLDTMPQHPAPLSRPLTVRDAWADMPHGPGMRCPLTNTRAAELIRATRPGETGSKVLRRAGRKANYFGMARLAWDRPAPTLIKNFRPGGSAAKIHPDEDRLPGSRELTRIQSFPDEYDWGSSAYRQIYNRLGNSVPPLFMRAIAETIASELLKGDHHGQERPLTEADPTAPAARRPSEPRQPRRAACAQRTT
jgi:DNA (cytosine-5)-methyltransferase 1